jgi:hypothetical protein
MMMRVVDCGILREGFAFLYFSPLTSALTGIAGLIAVRVFRRKTTLNLRHDGVGDPVWRHR